MSNFAKLYFILLNITRTNYMSWIIDREMQLESMSLTETIKEVNSMSSQDKVKTAIFIRRHLDEYLKCEYLIVRDPSVL